MRNIWRLLTASVFMLAGGSGLAQNQINPATQIRWPISCRTGNSAYVLSINQCLPFVQSTGDTMTGTLGINLSSTPSSSTALEINLNNAPGTFEMILNDTGNPPTMVWYRTDAGPNLKNWVMGIDPNSGFYIATGQDIGTPGSATPALQCSRNGTTPTGCRFPGGLQDSSGSTGLINQLAVAQGNGPWLWGMANPGSVKWPNTCTPGLVYSPAQNVCVAQGGSANNPALPLNSLQKNGGTNFAPASTADIGAAISGPNQNYIISTTIPTVGWPIPSNLGIANDLLWGTNAGQSLGNYTVLTHLGTASSGSTSVTLDSGAGVLQYMNVSGAGIAAGTTASAISGTTLTLSQPTTAALSSTPLNFTPGNTGSLIAIGNGACQACQDNNGSVVIGQGALGNDVGYGSGGEDQNGVFIGPFAGGGETGYTACSATLGTPANTFEPVIIGNKVGGSGCGWSGTQMIGNHIFGFFGTINSNIIGNEMGNGTTGVQLTTNNDVLIGSHIFNPWNKTGGGPPAGTYTSSSEICIGFDSCQSAENTSHNIAIGVGAFAGPVNGTILMSGTYNIAIGETTLSNLTTGSNNVSIGAVSGNQSAGQNLSTGSLNTFIGAGAGSSVTTGSQIVAIGHSAAGTGNQTNPMVAVGESACNQASGSGNVCVGNWAGNNITTGTGNIVVGSNNASGTGPSGAGSNNTEMGNVVGLGLDTSSNNSFYGASAGRRATASTAGTNEAFGYSEFLSSSGTTGTEQYNVFMGDNSSCTGCTNLISLGHTANFAANLTHAVQLDTGTNNASHTMQWETVNFLDDAGNASFKTVGVQSVPTIASAATIAPTSSLLKVSGTTAITTITPPTVAQNGAAFRGCIKIIPTGAWTTATGGNIALASTAIVNRVMDECYDGTSWYPSY